MSEHAQQSTLEPLQALVGEWTLELTHPAFEGTVVSGRCTFEWLEGESFLLQRSRNDPPDFPDSLGVIGVPEGELSMHYFDSRGVFRVYGMRFDDGVWKIWRDEPGFSQRFSGSFGEDGDTISGQWQLSRDDETWDDDLAVTSRRVA